jgi:hypothetical protein
MGMMTKGPMSRIFLLYRLQIDWRTRVQRCGV